MLGTFDLVDFKVILGSVGALASNLPASQKQLVREQNGLKFETHGMTWILVTDVWGIFVLVGVKVLWGHSVHLSQNGMYFKNGRSLSETEQNLGLVDTSNSHMYMGYI